MMKKFLRFKLQNLIFRSNSLPDQHFAMMYRGDKLTYDPLQSSFSLKDGQFTEFFTYFNSFSYGKWTKYTNVRSISLCIKAKGKFTIQLFGHYRRGEIIEKEFYPSHIFDFQEFETIEIPVSEDAKGTVIGFQIQSIRDFAVSEGCWCTYIDEKDVKDVRISIVTTTFKKESYIKRNVETIERELFYGSESCRDRFRMNIIDNGRTLDPDDFNDEYVTLFPNINAGGAGGFTRGIIESLHLKWAPTHILLMDDDVTILPEAFVRTYALLTLIKDEYSDYFISGAMLRNQQMNEQHEDIGYVVDDGYYRAAKPTMFLHLWDQVFINEEEKPQKPDSYAAWWYCCFPVTQIEENDLPLPVFIRCVDFSIRHKAHMITMNGIFVWHDDFKYKFNASMEFYMVVRNSLITQAIDGIYPNADFIGNINRLFMERIKAFSYSDCDLLLDAIEDYLKGPSFISEPRGEQIVKEKSAKNEKLKNLYEVLDTVKDVSAENITSGLYEPAELHGFKKFIYNATYNFQIFPARLMKKKTGVIPYDWFVAPSKNYGCTALLAVNESNYTGNLRMRSERRFLGLMKRRKKLMRRYKRCNNAVTAEYRAAGNVFRSETFWRKYLGIKEET